MAPFLLQEVDASLICSMDPCHGDDSCQAMDKGIIRYFGINAFL